MDSERSMMQQEREAPAPDAAATCALVPFSFRNPFHDALRDPLRRFPIAGRQLEIEQGWQNDGRGGTAIGFGASVYDAAILLSLYVDTHQGLVHGKRVIELGCGPGLVAVAAAHAGAQCVVATDGDPTSVELTQRNLDRNECPNSHAEKFLWGDEDHSLLAHEFDVILGADIVACPYVDAFEALLASFRALARTPETLLLLAYKRRQDSEATFFTRMSQEFTIEHVPEAELHADFHDSGISLFQARLKSQQ